MRNLVEPMHDVVAIEQIIHGVKNRLTCTVYLIVSASAKAFVSKSTRIFVVSSKLPATKMTRRVQLQVFPWHIFTKEGIGVEQSFREAIRWYSVASRMGHGEATPQIRKLYITLINFFDSYLALQTSLQALRAEAASLSSLGGNALCVTALVDNYAEVKMDDTVHADVAYSVGLAKKELEQREEIEKNTCRFSFGGVSCAAYY